MWCRPPRRFDTRTLPTLAQSEAECRRLQASYLLRTGLPMLIFERDAAGNEGALIGGAGLHRIDWTVRRFEIGYWCRSDRQRRGHVTDAVRMLSRFAFETLRARRVEIRMDADNVRSWRVAERAGYQLEGVLRSESLTPTGEPRDTSLFVAHRQAGGWVVALEDAADFAQTLQSAATELTSAEEKRIFATRADTLRSRLDAGPPDAKALAAGQDVGLSLPYRRNDASWGTWGVHGDSDTSRPYNSIDFKAGDGRVLASRGGVAYKFCTNGRWPFIKVVHDNGYTTGYYHLRNQPGITNGQRVAEGKFLGETGVELPCGGSASGNHVHWTLWRGNTSGQAESVEGKLIGGWVWHETNQAYGGYAERNGQRVSSGGNGLTNYGHGGETPSTPTTPTTPTKPTTPTPPSGNSPCTGASCKVYSGSIAQAGQFSTQPGDRGFQHTGGTLRGWLKGPAGANFGLILDKYNTRTGQWNRAWVNESAGSEKNLYYNAPAGTYRWRISAISGRGAYTLWTGK